MEPSRKLGATIVVGDLQEEFAPLADIIARLASVGEGQLFIEHTLPKTPEDDAAGPGQSALAMVVPGAEIYLTLGGALDIGKERARLEKELRQAEDDIFKSEKLLNGSFAERAPSNVVDKERARLAEAYERRTKFAAQLEALQGKS